MIIFYVSRYLVGYLLFIAFGFLLAMLLHFLRSIVPESFTLVVIRSELRKTAKNLQGLPYGVSCLVPC